MRAEARIAEANASAASDLLQLRRLEDHRRFLDGVTVAGAAAHLRHEVFAMEIARAYGGSNVFRTTIPAADDFTVPLPTANPTEEQDPQKNDPERNQR